ncbi:MAG: cryptochrome/photolyase family protein [Actinomycetales bacterium]
MRWIFGDQLGPHFDDGGQLLLVESLAAFARRPMHRAKAQIILSALRHRAAELGERATFVATASFDAALQQYQPSEVVDPTSRRARELVRRQPGLRILPARGFTASHEDFATWFNHRPERRRLRMEDWYRWHREQLGVLMDAEGPIGGKWNLDGENRLPPPKGQRDIGLPPAWMPAEDEIDEQVRETLDEWERQGWVRLIGADGKRRFAVTRGEALQAMEDFIEHRLVLFGPYEDATMEQDPVMAHSLLSVPMNLGLLHPLELVARATTAFEQGQASLASVEGLVRQVIGWREYVWQLYWHLGPDYERSNALHANTQLPGWFSDLDSTAVKARCLQQSLAAVHDWGWSHHIVRLMILSNWSLQRGYAPLEVRDWFVSRFVDGYDWVMDANVLGMGLYADGGVMATKPYAAGGAYINRMTNHCHSCVYKPTERVGPRACPFTAGYWAFLDRNEEALRGNHRMAQPLAGLRRLVDRVAVVEAEQKRGEQAP